MLARYGNIIDNDSKLTGTQINYLFICPTKLWYFSHHLNMEHSSDLVAAGRFIHESTYRREKKDIKIEGIAIDFAKKGEIIELHEVKKSKKMEKAHEMQALYYLYVLKQKGIKANAVIDYPLIRERKTLELDEQKEREVEGAIARVKEITSMEKPPGPKRILICPKCSYCELCWSD
ncbi:MAG: CRISPR-associated protein Cas4 [Candidatus Micrarchaeota archaeon]